MNIDKLGILKNLYNDNVAPTVEDSSQHNLNFDNKILSLFQHRHIANLL